MRSTFPMGLLGSDDTNRSCFGHLKRASRLSQKAMISSAEADGPSLRTTNATTSSPISGSFVPTTAASATAGCA